MAAHFYTKNQSDNFVLTTRVLASPQPSQKCSLYVPRWLVKAGVALVCLIGSSVLMAKEYRVEAIIFKQNNGGAAMESHRYNPPSSVLSPSETWAIKPSLLVKEFAAIDASSDYEVIKRYSWAQQSLPYSESASMSFYEPELKGWIKVYANNLLYVNLDLEMQGYRLSEKRRIKLDEKHFFDHPKFGVLLQVSRMESGASAPNESSPAE